MDTGNTQDGAEPSPASAGSVDELGPVPPATDTGIRLSLLRWIPVAERLPPVNQRVLYTCFIDDGDASWWIEVNIGRWDGKAINLAGTPAMKYDDSDDWEPCTHWMPLPAPPDGDMNRDTASR